MELWKKTTEQVPADHLCVLGYDVGLAYYWLHRVGDRWYVKKPGSEVVEEWYDTRYWVRPDYWLAPPTKETEKQWNDPSTTLPDIDEIVIGYYKTDGWGFHFVVYQENGWHQSPDSGGKPVAAPMLWTTGCEDWK